MAIELDHLILEVADRAESAAFYARVLGLAQEADDGPFSVLRVSDALVILLAESERPGHRHLAFSMTPAEFERVFAALKREAVPFGDRYDRVGNGEGPGEETGARGLGEAVYFHDPSRNLLEIRRYA